MAEWKQDLLVLNKYSRPGIKLLDVLAIVMHWTATPGASDENEVSFFDGADGGGSRYAGAHIFVDRDSATLDIPLNEVAYHANEKPCKVSRLAKTASYYKGGGANLCTIGIEMCVEKDGTIHPDTIARASKVVAALCKQFKLDPEKDIYRHYDITGKNCPAPWVSKPADFTKFKDTVDKLVNPPAPKPAAKPVTKPVAKPASKPATVPSVAGKRVEALTTVRFYSKPSWNDKDVIGSVTKGLGFTIVGKVRVDGSYQYQVKNSKGDVYYITASSKFVKVE